MPHATVKLNPGVDQNETPALNETGFSSTNLIRFVFDRNGVGLIQKLGGWTRFYPSPMAYVVREMWAFEDTIGLAHLAVGTGAWVSPNRSQMLMINQQPNTSRLSTLDITPTSTISNQVVDPALAFSATTIMGSSIVVITDNVNTGITGFDSVYIPTPVAVGGLILFGLYACNPDAYSGSPTAYHIRAVDVLGNPLPAPSGSSSPVFAKLTTVSGTATVTVNLPNHGYSAGEDFPILVSTSVGGISFYSHYPVVTVIDADNFTITGSALATSSTSGYINGNEVQLIYSFGISPPITGTGFGVGGFGRGGFGTGVAVTPASGSYIDAQDWTIDNWGEVLVFCPIEDAADFPTSADFRPIYIWDAEAGIPIATALDAPGAPPVNNGIFVAMPQRQIIAWGSTDNGIADPLLVRWCDVNNYNTWVDLVTNEAGQFRLPRGSKIVSGMQGPNQGLLWTDVGVWAMQYIGPPDVYGFNEIGQGCGLIGFRAMGALNGVVYWMGPSQFYVLAGGGVTLLACPVWDVVFQDLDVANASKIRCAVNSRFGEVAWYYPVLVNGEGAGEVSAYVKYNTILQQWDFGQLARTAWVDQSVWGPPLGADPATLLIYQHETSPDADGQAMTPSFQTGYFAMADGDAKVFVDQVWPDMKWGYYNGPQSATVNLTFSVADYAGQTPTVFGPYALTQSTTFITPRFRGRLISIGMSGDDVGSFWRIGALRYRWQPDGKI